jgi:hypothetical protein
MSYRMNRSGALVSKIGIGVLAALMLMGGLCRKTKGTTITVVNGTDNPIRNVEVTYSGGNIGSAAVAPGDQLKKWVPAKGNCYVKLTFLDTANKQVQPTVVDTKQPCPAVVTFTVASDLKVTTNLQ